MSPHYRIQPNVAQPGSNVPSNDWNQRYNAGNVPGQVGAQYYQQPSLTPQQQQQYNELQGCQMELEKLRVQHPRTPEVIQRAEHLQAKIAYLRSQLQPQLQAQMMQQQMSNTGMVQPGVRPQQPIQQAQSHYTPQPAHPPGQMAAYPTTNTSSAPPQQQNAQIGMPTTNREVTGAPSSSVSVMQPAPNQVQVNITPENAPCRTLISVYHQYPAPNVSTNVTTPSLSSGKIFRSLGW